MPNTPESPSKEKLLLNLNYFSTKSRQKPPLLSTLLRILLSFSLFMTMGFIVWSWSHMTKGYEEDIKKNNIPRMIYKISEFDKNSSDLRNLVHTSIPIISIHNNTENELVQTFADRREVADKYCQDVRNSTQGHHRSTFISRNLTQRLYHKLPKILTSRNTPDINRRNWLFFKFDSDENEFLNSNNMNVSIEWCPVYKAASSPWMAVFGKLSNIVTSNTENLIQRGKLTFIKLLKDFRLNIPFIQNFYESNSKMKNYKMVVVRHPFDRLLSAYRDKIERIQGRDFYYRKYGYRILTQFRHAKEMEKIAKLEMIKKDVFHSMLSQLLELRNGVRYIEVNGTRTKVFDEKRPISQARPTFREFVQYLLRADPNSMDEHWRPMYLDCNPCQYSFDLILKVESMDSDRDIVFKLLQLTNGSTSWKNLEKIWKRWINKGVNPRNSSNTPYRDSRYYFSQVTKSDLQLLYLIYEPDFLLFNYSPKVFFDMGINP